VLCYVDWGNSKTCLASDRECLRWPFSEVVAQEQIAALRAKAKKIPAAPLPAGNNQMSKIYSLYED